MRRRPLHRLWIVLALLFLAEAWLWDHLEPIVARVVNLFPWGKLKEKLAQLIENLPPWATLFVFVVPFIVMLPLKFLEVYFLATRNWLGAIGVIIFVKLVGLGVTAFIFDVTRDKLMQMAWFRRMYDWVIGLRDWAHTITEPVRERVRQLTWLLKPQRAGRFLRRFMHLRRNANRNRTA
jgi:ABC-type transport system involved in cytochrome bd biosynthesis fused ATPase/permease subunit